MPWHQYIEQRPDVMFGKPVFKGTRLTVQTILERLAQNASENDLLNDYPRLTHNHIRAAIAFSTRSIDGETPRSRTRLHLIAGMIGGYFLIVWLALQCVVVDPSARTAPHWDEQVVLLSAVMGIGIFFFGQRNSNPH